LKVTVPVAAAVPGVTATVAVKVTFVPETTLLADAVSPVVVAVGAGAVTVSVPLTNVVT
jgi:hypothetical protein